MKAGVSFRREGLIVMSPVDDYPFESWMLRLFYGGQLDKILIAETLVEVNVVRLVGLPPDCGIFTRRDRCPGNMSYETADRSPPEFIKPAGNGLRKEREMNDGNQALECPEVICAALPHQ